jgi:hypothetical protein
MLEIEALGEPLKKPIAVVELIKRYVEELIADSNMKQFLFKFFEDYNRKLAADIATEMSKGLKSSFGVLSLSEINNSILMWSHYARSHTGFCIEYDFGSLEYWDLRRRLCFPVFYRKKFTNVARWMDFSSGNFNNLAAQYWCLIKSDHWAYEKEWRILEAIGAQYSNRQISMPKPSALIIGAHASETTAAALRAFASENNIQLKQAVKIPNSYAMQIEEFV